MFDLITNRKAGGFGAAKGALRACVLLAVCQLAAAPALAQEKGVIGKFLERFSKKEEVAENVEQGPDFSKSACPEDARWMGLAESFPEQCGLDRPPPSYDEQHWLDGVWDVYTPGDQPFDHVKIYVHMKEGILHRVDPNQPSPAMAVVRYKGESQYSQGGGAVILRQQEDGSIETGLGQFGYCSCVSVNWRMRRTGDPNILRGEWEYDGKRGSSVWRRSSGVGIVRSVVISAAVHNAEGNLVEDRFDYGSRRGRLERDHPVSCGYGDMRGNCDSVYVTVYGDRFFGAHDIWLDPASHIELYSAAWICKYGGGQDYVWRYCDGAGEPGSGVAGVQAHLIFWPGMTPGPINLWVDGQPIPIDVILAGYPEDESPERPALVSLEATNTDGSPVARIEEGEAFMLTATYNGDHPDVWTRVAAPNLPSTEVAGKLVEQEVILQRSDDPKVFKSAWMTVKRSVVSPVVDAPLGEEEAEQP